MRELKQMREEAEQADELFDEDGVSYEDLSPRKRRELLALKGLVRIDELVEASGFGRQLQEELEAVSSAIWSESLCSSLSSTCTMSLRSQERMTYPAKGATIARRARRKMIPRTRETRWTRWNDARGTFALAIPKLRMARTKMTCQSYTTMAQNAAFRRRHPLWPHAVT